jgi:hypothetical protein
MNGQERAEQNFQTFLSWVATKTDVDLREMVTLAQGLLDSRILHKGRAAEA